MTLSHWFACSELHLSARAMTNFLDVVTCLDDLGRDPELVGCALETLAGADTRLQALAVPDLMEFLAVRPEDELRNRAAALVLDVTGPLLTPGVLASIADLSPTAVTRLVSALTPARPRRDLLPFADLVESAPHLLGLSLLRQVLRLEAKDTAATHSEGDPEEDSVAETVGAADHLLRGEDELWYLAAARVGALGRVPLLLATESLMLGGEAPAALIDGLGMYSSGEWLGQPDLVRTRLRLELANRGADAPAERAAWLCDEAVTLRLYADRTDAAGVTGTGWLALANQVQGAAAQVALWQAVCWEEAVRVDAVVAAPAVAGAWGAPDPRRSGFEILHLPGQLDVLRPPLSYLAAQRARHRDQTGPTQVKLTPDASRENTASAVAAAFSPWMDRSGPAYHPSGREDQDLDQPPKTYPAIDDDVAVLRLVANSRTVTRLIEELLRVGEPVPGHVWDLFLNMCDALSNVRLREALKSLSRGETVPSQQRRLRPVILSLVLAAKEHLDRAGKGELHPEIPSALAVRIRVQCESTDYRRRQILWLYQQAAVMAVAHLVWEVLSGELPSAPAARSTWLRGGTDSPAAAVLQILFGPVWDRLKYPSSSIQEPGLLSADTFPTYVQSRAGWDWVKTYLETSYGMRPPQVLLSARLPLERWQALDPLDSQRFVGGGWFAALTLRLEALVEAGGLTEDHPWMTEWVDHLASVNRHDLLARAVRRELIWFLGRLANSAAEYDVQRRALRAVLEFSAQAIRYQDAAGLALFESRSGQGMERADSVELGSEWIYAMSRPEAADNQNGRGPWARRGALVAGQQRSRSVLTHVCRLLGSGVPPAFAEALDRIDMAGTTPLATMERSGATGTDIALAYQRRGGLEWVARAPTAAGVALGGPGALLDEQVKGARLGVTAGRMSDDETANVLINDGTGAPVAGPRLDWPAGDLVAVRRGEVVPLPAPAGRPGDVVPVHVTWQDGLLTVRPRDRSPWTAGERDRDALLRWLPDPLAAVADGFAADVLARRTQEGTWVPVGRDLTRLVVERFHQGADQPLVVVSESEDGEEWALGGAFGQHYSVPAESMGAALVDALAAERMVLHGGTERSLAALRFRARLTVEDERPVLDLATDDPTPGVDDVSMRWRDRFRDQPFHTAQRVGNGWVIASEDGHPPVRVHFSPTDAPPPDDQRTRVRLRPGSWDALAQRRGLVHAVHVPYDALPVREWEDLAVLRGYLDAAVGSAFRLAELTGSATHGYLAAVTTTGMPVSVAADSLSFLPGTPDPGLIAGREVHVQRFVVRPEVANLAAMPFALDVPTLEQTTLVGLVARRAEGAAEVDVWLAADDRAVLVPVPLSAFATGVGPVGTRVTATRTGAAWTFTCEHRELMTRAAWSVQPGPAPALAVALSVVNVPGAGPALVLQAPDRPVLFAVDAGQADADLTCAVPRGGRVRQVRRGFTTDAVGRTLDIVVLSSGGEPVMGHSAPGAFRTPSPWLTAQLVLERHTDQSGEWLDARREFTQGRAVRQPGAPRRTASEPELRLTGAVEAPSTWPVGYPEWLDEGSRHALASVVAGAKGSVRLLELQLPEDPGMPGSEPIETVPLLMGEHKSHLSGHGYDTSRVRVRLRHDQRGWTASYRTQPLTLQEFSRNVLAVQGADRRRFRIWYVGRTPAGLHRFEWGYGWTLELSEEQVSVRDGRLSLFFNDCLTDLSVVARRRADGSDNMSLQIGYVRWEVERLMRDDAAQGMLHQVQVRLRTTEGGRTRVQVEGVHTQTRAMPGAGDVRATTFMRTFHAEFDRDSEKLIARLGGRVQEGAVITVLARLNQSRTPGVDGVIRSQFSFLTTDPDGEARLPATGESLILIAGTVRRTGRAGGISNDYEIPFELGLDPAVGVPSLDVRVLRGQFSFRESALRQAFRSGSADRYHGVSMLVRLVKRDPRGGWLGSVVDAPSRPWANVRQWARLDLDHAQVTVGERRDGGAAVLVEPWPGVVGRFELGQQQAPAHGSLCRIDVADGSLRLVPLVPGGSRYVPDPGRPVLLLLKDNVLRRRDTEGRGGFTVAGLPGVRVDDDAAATQAKYRRPPRLGIIRRVGRGFGLVTQAFVRAGRLTPLPGDRPQVRVFGKREEPPSLDWPQLSFGDRAPHELVKHTRRGRWRYHDEMTGFLHNGRLEEVRFPDPIRSSDGPLFLDDRWRLRYEPSELLRFGYSAAEVLEHGLPKDNDWYPVAAPARGGGIWVELSPGRLAELSGLLVRSSATSANMLDQLPWGLFAAGDEVLLDSRATRSSAVSAVVLKAWRPGPRGWFGRARALLVPGTDGRGRRSLGSGSATLAWSGTGELGDDPVWLHPDNTLEPYADDVAPGNVVVLRESDGPSLRIDGAADLNVRLAEDWGPHAWLRAALEDRDRRRSVLGPLGGALPVVVTAAASDGVVVGPVNPVPAGGVLAVTVLGRLDAERALVRSGTALLPVELADLVPGVPEEARGAVVERLVSLDQLTWLHHHEGRWASPALSERRTDTFRARALAAVPGGLVLVSEVDLALEWLPLTELGAVADETADAVFEFVRKSGSVLDVVETDPGAVSFLQTHEGRRVRRHLASGDAVLAVPQALVGQETSHIWTYLASMHPTMAVITVRSETELVLGEPIAIEVDNQRDMLTAIPQGQGRTALLLAPWLLAALREARTGRSIDFGVVAKHASRHVDPYLAETHDSRESRLVSTLRARLDTPGAPVDGPLRELLADWLTGPGGALLTGRTGAATAPDSGAWDLAPLLAGTLLLAELGAVSPRAAALSVHAGFRLGALATGAVHQEVLLRDWLLRGTEDVRHDRWVRLDHLDLGGRTVPRGGGQVGDPYVRPGALNDPQFDGLLTRSQHSELRHATDGVLGARLEPDARLRSTARMLAFAVGRFDHMDENLADFGTTHLARVAALGRALTPGAGAKTAQPRLTVWQVDQLRRQLSGCLTQRLPLTLLPDNAPRVLDQLAEWATQEVADLIDELASQG